MNLHPALGIDYGDARIGIAASDPVGIMAHPVETIANTGPAAVIDRIRSIIATRQIKVLVLGLPIRMDGTEGSAAEKVRVFGEYLHQSIPSLPLYYADECLTTVIAAEKLRQAGKKTKNHRPIIDQAAAVEILQHWMDSLPDMQS